MSRGGYRPNSGRKMGVPVKPAEKKKSQRIIVLATPAEEEELRKRADESGLSLSRYMVFKALKK